jgi:hypothetical protein
VIERGLPVSMPSLSTPESDSAFTKIGDRAGDLGEGAP